MKTKDLPNVEKVHLQPLFGIKPGIWLTALYSFVLIAAVFLVCFLPGIMHGFVRVSFTSAAYNAAVYQDGSYIGGTPFTRSVESGSHQFSFRIGNTEIDKIQTDIDHPVFLTWLFPRHIEINSLANLSGDAFEELTSAFLSDVASYSRILEYDRVHIYPDLFTSYANAVCGTQFDYKTAYETASLFITTDEMLNDAIRGAQIIGLESPVFEEARNYIVNPLYGQVKYDGCVPGNKTQLVSPFFTVDGISREDGISIAEICVTEPQYSVFVQENPEFKAECKSELESNGIADFWYLDGISLSGASNSLKPVRNISYKAALSFCKWLSSVTGKEVFIPDEEIWTSFCKASDQHYRNSVSPVLSGDGPYAMLGGVWEMTSSAYIPLRFLANDKVDDYLSDKNVKTEITVKGGSFINSGNTVDADTAGSVPVNMCSDFLGFRIAWK